MAYAGRNNVTEEVVELVYSYEYLSNEEIVEILCSIDPQKMSFAESTIQKIKNGDYDHKLGSGRNRQNHDPSYRRTTTVQQGNGGNPVFPRTKTGSGTGKNFSLSQSEKKLFPFLGLALILFVVLAQTGLLQVLGQPLIPLYESLSSLFFGLSLLFFFLNMFAGLDWFLPLAGCCFSIALHFSCSRLYLIGDGDVNTFFTMGVMFFLAPLVVMFQLFRKN